MRVKAMIAASAALAVSGCVSVNVAETPETAAAAPTSIEAALAPYYGNFPHALPTAGPGRPLPAANQALTRIAFGSCYTAEQPIPILRTAAAEKADLFVYLGDNVYGDARAGDMNLPELREQYALLAAHQDFQALRAATPMIATWDDHDYGLNDAGGDFTGKGLAKRIFANFWGVESRIAAHEGVYDSYTFGPEGQRVQILLLDTRFARSELARLKERGPRGPYAQSDAADQRMLSEAQWAWLAAKLKEPADLRIVASSIQVLADGHDFEAWETLPKEQARLYRTIREADAKGVVFVSGDRHSAGLYRQEGLIGAPAYELTTSSLNLSFRSTSDEKSTNQLGDMYAPVNYGMIAIDWRARSLSLQIKDAAGVVVRERAVGFAELGL